MLKVLSYFASLHELDLFHGDIKCDNIFFEKPSKDDFWKVKEISVDAGSITKMKGVYDKNVVENNFVKTATRGYCSPAFGKKWREKQPFNFKELIVEDIH